MSSPLVPVAATDDVYHLADTGAQASDWILGSRCPEIQRSRRLRHRGAGSPVYPAWGESQRDASVVV